MTAQNLENYKTLHGISFNSANKTINVEVGLVSWDLDVQCICDAIEFLATTGKGFKSITIQSFNINNFNLTLCIKLY